MKKKSEDIRNPRFMRRAMAYNFSYFSPMIMLLINLLTTVEQRRDAALKDAEEMYKEAYMQIVFLPLTLQQNLQTFGMGDKKVQQKYYAEFSQDYGDTVALINTMGWLLVDNEYENCILDSARLIMDEWGKRESSIRWDEFWPGFRMVSCQEGPNKVWTVRWKVDQSSLSEETFLETRHTGRDYPVLTITQN